MCGKFDYVVDGGTIEHVFDIAKAILNISSMAKIGGTIIHITPMAGTINHGFYNVSPNAFLEYYHKNGFDLKTLDMEFVFGKEESYKKQVCVFSQDCRMFSGWHKPITEYVNMVNQIQEICGILLWCIAERKTYTSSYEYPMQGEYESFYMEFQQESKRIAAKTGPRENAINFLKANRDKRIALYCTGGVCNLLLDELYKNDMDHMVQYLFNSNPSRAGTVQRGYTIYYPTKSKLDAVDMILICLDKYDDKIYSLLKKMASTRERERCSESILTWRSNIE